MTLGECLLITNDIHANIYVYMLKIHKDLSFVIFLEYENKGLRQGIRPKTNFKEFWSHFIVCLEGE